MKAKPPVLAQIQLDQLELNNPFWHFSLEQWTKPALQAQLLALQNKQDYRINLLLLAMWLSFEQRDLRPHIHQFIEDSQAWHEQVVVPLRTTRQRLPMSAAELKKQVQACELQAEQIEQALLYATSMNCDADHQLTDQSLAYDSLDWLICNLSASGLTESDLFLLVQSCLPVYPADRIRQRMSRHLAASQ